jgi:pimeloyl-ACP methyl ester carboxylesterase
MRPAPLVLGAAAASGLVLAKRRAAAAPDAWPVLSGRTVPVTADDGVALHVEVHGDEQAQGTVVLAHGYVLSNRLWDRQVEALLEARPDLRVVTYDQRGHGRSQRGERKRSTIEQLAHDLRAVLDATAPTGPVVLAGHSMGGMTLMALAEQYPELLGPRVVGVGLVATSSGDLDKLTLGFPEPVSARVRAGLPKSMARAARWEDAGRRPLPMPFLKPVLFGTQPDPADVRRTLQVIAGCSAHTFADFFETFTLHARLDALAAMASVPVMILIGTKDRLCPIAHSRTMAGALPHAALHVYPGAGHMLQLERAAEVSARLVELASVVPARHLTAV